jgi:hypothetical protein
MDVTERPVGTPNSLLIFDRGMMITPFCSNKNKVTLILSNMHRGRKVATHLPEPEIVNIF